MVVVAVSFFDVVLALYDALLVGVAPSSRAGVRGLVSGDGCVNVGDGRGRCGVVGGFGDLGV